MDIFVIETSISDSKNKEIGFTTTNNVLCASFHQFDVIKNFEIFKLKNR